MLSLLKTLTISLEQAINYDEVYCIGVYWVNIQRKPTILPKYDLWILIFLNICLYLGLFGVMMQLSGEVVCFLSAYNEPNVLYSVLSLINLL